MRTADPGSASFPAASEPSLAGSCRSRPVGSLLASESGRRAAGARGELLLADPRKGLAEAGKDEGVAKVSEAPGWGGEPPGGEAPPLAGRGGAKPGEWGET